LTAPDPSVGFAVHAVVCVLLALGLLGAAALLRYRVRRPPAERGAVYECGEPPEGEPWRGLPVGFYLVALLFILFDVEAAFLFLWVESLREAGPLAFWGMIVFLAILLLGWLVALRKGDLDWSRYR
jgi:NADH-quinone oxidoreductase subunit A